MEAGKEYEELVAIVLRSLDPGATVDAGEWTEGPDGRLDLDVEIRGTADGSDRLVLIKCKHSGRPVGVDIVNALKSKREDLGADPTLPVDVSLNGECVLPGFEFGNIVGPVTLLPDTYDIAISLADPGNPCGNAPVISAACVELEVDTNHSIVAHLDAVGSLANETFTLLLQPVPN